MTRQTRVAYAFLAPGLLLFAAYRLYPLLEGLRLSFTNARLGRPLQQWVGLANYTRLLEDTRFHVSRVFARATGMTLTRFRNRVRVAIALDRLAEGHDSLAMLAADLGFVDQSHFHRRFKGAFGMTPAEWQRCTAIQDTSRDNR